MVITPPRIAGVAALLAAAVAAFLFLRPSDESRIRRLVEEMAPLASFDSRKGNIAFLGDLRKLVSRFQPDAELHFEEVGTVSLGSFNATQIEQLAISARQAVGNLAVTIDPVEVTLDGDQAARARFGVTARTGQGRGEIQGQGFEARLARVEGRWKITRLEALPLLSRRPVAEP